MRRLAKVNRKVEVRRALEEVLLERETSRQELANFRAYTAKEVK